MATGNYQPIKLWNWEDFRNGLLPMPYVVESASLAAKAGAPCTIDSNGRLAECGTTFKQAAFVLVDDGSNAASAGTSIQAWALNRDMIFEVTLNEAWAQNLIGKSYGLVKDGTTGDWYASTADTGNQVNIIGAPSSTAVGDTKMRVLVRFNQSAIQFNNNGTNSLLPGVGAALASATTIAPTNLVHHVTGTTNVVNITIPAGFPDGGQFTIIPDGLFATTNAGNIAIATTAVVSKAIIYTYDRTAAKVYPSY